MNLLQTENLYEEAKRKSKFIPDITLYILIKENQGVLTPNREYVKCLSKRGFKLCANVRNGEVFDNE